MAAVREHRPDVVLMDIRMAEMDGITATAALRRLDRAAAGDRADHLPGRRAGDERAARRRQRVPGQGHAARRDHQRGPGRRHGDAIISPSVTRTLLAHFGDTEASERRRVAAQRLAALTDREREVADAIGSGASNAEVAASLFMSEATVKSHVSRLFTKLDVANRVQIAILVHDADPS